MKWKKVEVVRTTFTTALTGQSSQFQGRILVVFEDYKYGLKNTTCFILKIQLRAGKKGERHTESVKAQIISRGFNYQANPWESIYSRNIEGSNVKSQDIDWTILYNNTLMRSFSDENESIINGEGEVCCNSSDNMQRLERRFRGGNKRPVTAAFWEKTLQIRGKGSTFQCTGSSFFTSVSTFVSGKLPKTLM